MKKYLLVLIASLALQGSIFAQHVTHWPDFNYQAYEQNGGFLGIVQLDDEMITPQATILIMRWIFMLMAL